MKKNMSKTDGIIRIILAIAVGVLYYFGIIGGTLAIILAVVAVIFVITGFINFCPLYSIFGFKTKSE